LRSSAARWLHGRWRRGNQVHLALFYDAQLDIGAMD
jgi:hypothetical protein